MLGINEIDRKLKPRGFVLIETETSFSHEALIRKILSDDSTLVYLDGPQKLGEELYGKKPVGETFFFDVIAGKEFPKPVIVSLTSVFYMPRKAKIERPEEILFFLGHLRLKYKDSISVGLIHYDAVPEKFSNLLEINADVALRIHPMGKKAVAIVRRHKVPQLVGETIEFTLRRERSMVRDLIEEARERPERIKEILKALEGKSVERSVINALKDLLPALKDKDEEYYGRLVEFLKRHGVSIEEIEACVEENIEEYER